MMPYEFGDIVLVPFPFTEDVTDPALAPFLNLLARDIAKRPEALVPLSKLLLARIERLTTDVAVDLDQAIKGDVAL